MKKLLYLLVFFSIFISLSLYPLESDEMRFDNLAKVQDAMDEIPMGHYLDHVEPVVHQSGLDLKEESMINTMSFPIIHSSETDSGLLVHSKKDEDHITEPISSSKDENNFQSKIREHEEIVRRQSVVVHQLANTITSLNNLVRKEMNTYLEHADVVSENQKEWIKNSNVIVELYGKALNVHRDIVSLLSSFQVLEKSGFKVGHKAEVLVAELSSEALKLSGHADEKMKDLLGITLVVNL